MHPQELIIHAQNEYDEWFDFDVNLRVSEEAQTVRSDKKNIQALSLQNICTLNGSWNQKSQYS